MHPRWWFVPFLAARLAAAEPAVEFPRGFPAARFPATPRDPAGGWHFERRDLPAFDAVEWQARLAAPAAAPSPLHDHPESAAFVVRLPGSGPVSVHWSRGSHDAAGDFEPREDALVAGRPFGAASFGGRSSDGAMPYFNLARAGGGLVVAVGWTGDWKASFESLGDGRVRVRAGMQHARFRLAPGESARQPAVLAMAYAGDWIAGQNRFRRLMAAEFTPASPPASRLMPVAASVHGMIGFNDTTAANLARLASDLGAARLPLDTFWVDAGWNEGGFPRGQGNPEPDAARFPRGLAPVGAAARAAGMRFLAWFEPERAMRGTWLDREHPDWLLSPAGTPPELRYQERDGFRLLDLGNPAARAWAVDEVSGKIAEWGVGVYRQDCNLYPAWFWRNGEAEGREGMREIRHVEGLYAYLDELARRHPGLVLDNCASGGRRLDFEMMRRCAALWRSDSCWGTPAYPRSVQAMTHGLSLWLPLHGLGAAATDEDALRSGMGSCASFAVNYRDAASVAALRRHLARYLPLRPLFAARYTPLTPWTADPARTLAFQFDDPASGAGLAQVFPGTATNAVPDVVRPRGLEPRRRYRVVDWDGDAAGTVRTGAELMASGWPAVPAAASRARVFAWTAAGR